MSLSLISKLSNLLHAIPLYLVFIASASAQTAVDLEFDVNVTDAGARRADDVLRTSVVAQAIDAIPERNWNKFFKDQRVGDILIDTIDISKDSTSLQDLKRRIKKIGPLVSRIVKAGGRVQLVFQHGIPKWLSSDPHNNGDLFEGGLSEGIKIWHSAPPSDYKVWEEVAYEFVNYYTNVLDTRGQVYYIIGNEPENYWVGSEDEWHRYYEHFVKGARKADPNAKVGGVNTAGIKAKELTRSKHHKQGGKVVFEEVPTRGKKGMVYNWLEYSARKNLPVDVITWHDYPATNPIPGNTANWVAFEKQLKAWTSSLGLSDTELILNDWPEWMPVPYENDSEFQAAYVVSGLISMIEYTSVKALYLGMIDIGAYIDKEEKRKNATFGGGTGMFTSAGLAKPVFNAYALMSKMEGNLISVDTGDEFVRGLASVDGDNVYILLTNFIPSKRLIAQNTYGADLDAFAQIDKKALNRKMKNSGKNKKQILQSVLDGSADLQKLDLPPAANKKIEGIRKVYAEGKQRMKAPADVKIRLEGLKVARNAQSVSYDEYVIDRSHANSYAIRKKIGDQARSSGAMNNRSKLREIVDEANAKTDIESGRMKNDATVRDGAIELNASLEPNSVHLIVLRRGKAN